MKGWKDILGYLGPGLTWHSGALGADVLVPQGSANGKSSLPGGKLTLAAAVLTRCETT